MKTKFIKLGSKEELKLQLVNYILQNATKESRYQGRTIYRLDTSNFNQIEFDKSVTKIKEKEVL